MGMIHIYTLFELSLEGTETVRYVGQTLHPKKRFSWHKSAARRGQKNLVYDWIRLCFANDVDIGFRVIETCSTYGDGNRAEIKWIQHYRDRGYQLMNATRGGEGTHGHKHSEETKAKIGATHRGKTVSSETRQRLSEINKGKILSPEHRAAISAGGMGRIVTPEQCQAISERMMGNQNPLGCKRSNETKVKQFAAKAGEKGAKAKCTNDQAVEIRRLFAEGVTQADIMRKFDLDRVTVHRIVRRKTYTTC